MLAYYCSQCCDSVHTSVFFHRPQVWRGTIFLPWGGPITTFERHNHDCTTKYFKEMCLIDAKGIQQKAKMAFCRCEPESVGLIRFGFWPTTPQQPRVAVDLQLMELTSVLELEGQLSLKNFCEVLDHREIFSIHSVKAMKDVYKVLVGDCVNEYRYHRSQMKMCSQLDCGTCPACSKSSEKKTVAVDANFGLVHKKSSGEGFGLRHKTNPFFFDQMEVDNYVNSYKGSRKETGCSSFQAGNSLRSKNKTEKLDITGVFGSVCKHDHPLHFCNLRHGEKLAYPVLFLEKLHLESPGQIVFMYDIACMLRKHLMNNDRVDLISNTTFAVPVFHSFAHNRPCQVSFGQKNVIPTGMSDGEGTERLWSFLRKFNRISKEMTVGNRHDLLVDALFHYSEKITSKLDEKLEMKLNISLSAKEKALETVTKQVSLDEAKLLFEQRATMNKKNVHTKDVNLTVTNEEEFSWLSLEASNKKKEIEASTLSEKENLSDQLQKIEKKLEKIRKKVTVQHYQLEELLCSYKKKKSTTLKKEMKMLAAERLHLLSSLKKYADGQDIAIRLTRQLQTTCGKIKCHLEAYNKLQHSVSQQINFSEVTNLQSMFFFDAEVDTMTVCQNQIADEYASFLRADVEITDSISDMRNLITWTKKQQDTLLSKLTEIQVGEITRFSEGHKSLLLVRAFNFEQFLLRAKNRFVKHFDISLKTPVSDHILDLLQITHFETLFSSNEVKSLLEEQDHLEIASESSDDDTGDEFEGDI